MPFVNTIARIKTRVRRTGQKLQGPQQFPLLPTRLRIGICTSGAECYGSLEWRAGTIVPDTLKIRMSVCRTWNLPVEVRTARDEEARQDDNQVCLGFMGCIDYAAGPPKID